jgi:hypothetical protein
MELLCLDRRYLGHLIGPIDLRRRAQINLGATLAEASACTLLNYYENLRSAYDKMNVAEKEFRPSLIVAR